MLVPKGKPEASAQKRSHGNITYSRIRKILPTLILRKIRVRRKLHQVQPRERRAAQRAQGLQPDVQDLRRRDGGRIVDHLPAARDGAGHVRPVQERARGRAQEAALRHRANRQGVPQRDQPAQLHLPLARVRADGSRIFRQAGHRPRVAGKVEGGPARLVRGHRHPAREDPRPDRAGRRPRVLFAGHLRSRIRISVRHPGTRGHRPSRQLRSHAARRSQRQAARIFRRGSEAEISARGRRAERGRRPHRAGAALRGLRRGDGEGRGKRQGRDAHGAAVRAAHGAGQGRHFPAAQEQARAGGQGARPCRRCCSR